MFRKKFKKDKKGIEKRIESKKQAAEEILTSTSTVFQNKILENDFFVKKIAEINDWLSDWDEEIFERLYNSKIDIENILDQLLNFKKDLDTKSEFIASLEKYEIDLSVIVSKIQTIAKNIPISNSLLDLESINKEIDLIKTDLDMLPQISNDLFTRYLNDKERLKYDTLKNKKESNEKKIPIITKKLFIQKDKFEVTAREFEISEERKKLFNWIDTFEHRSKKIEEKINKLFDELEEITTLTGIEELESKIIKVKDDLKVLNPPEVKTPEVMKQVANMSSKLDEKIKKFNDSFDELSENLDRHLIELIASVRSDRLIRKFLSTKRIHTNVFIELIRGNEKFTLNWLKSLSEEEPLRLQDESSLIALSLARVQEGKQLYEYLNEKMVDYSTLEKENHELFNHTLLVFKEVEGFKK